MVEPTPLKNMLVKMGSSSPIFGRKKNLENQHPGKWHVILVVRFWRENIFTVFQGETPKKLNILLITVDGSEIPFQGQPPFGWCIEPVVNNGRFQLPTSLNWWVNPGFLVAINSGFYPSTSDSTSRSRLGKLGFVWKSWKHVVFVDNNEVLVGGFNPFEKY